MRSFRQIAIVSCVALASVSAAYGQGNTTTPYRDALKTCGQEWRASDARKTDKTTKAWQAFRKECVTRQGWQAKR